MATITRVRLELPAQLGDKYRAKVRYQLTFTQVEVGAGVIYRHTLRLIADDTKTGSIFDDGHDDNIRLLRNEQVTAQANPIKVEVDEGPFSVEELDEDLGSDQIRARVELRPTSAFSEFATRRRASGMIVLQ
jgi:hypothetical protein